MAREARLKRRRSGSVNVSAFARQSFEYAAGKACVEHLEKRLLFAGFTGTTAFTVTDATDNPSDTGSLRYAINNLAPGDNTIDFNIPYFSSTTLDMSQGEFVINQNVTITGPSGEGVNPATIDAGDLSRIFDIPDSATTVTISNFTLQNGESTAGEGGAIYNAGNLTLNNIRLMDNTAQGAAGSSAIDAGAGGGGAGMGGAIFNDTTGVLALSETGIVGNAAIGGAGGNSSFAGMESPGNGGGANGGIAVGGNGPDGGFGGGGAGGSGSGFALAGGAGGFGGGGGGGASSDGAGFPGGSQGTFGGAGESGDTAGNAGAGGGGAGIGGGIFNNGGELIFDGSDFIEGNTATGGAAESHKTVKPPRERGSPPACSRSLPTPATMAPTPCETR